MIQGGMEGSGFGTTQRFDAEERLLLFEIGSDTYALPVDGLRDDSYATLSAMRIACSSSVSRTTR